MQFEIAPIGYVQTIRKVAEDDFWGNTRSTIQLTDDFGPQALAGLQDFSHVEVIFVFHRVDSSRIVSDARHPRSNKNWPKTGIFAQRGKNRPNRLGSTICRVISVNDRTLIVEELDAIDGTPVIDIKPIMIEFLPRTTVTQPPWSTELMEEYWEDGAETANEESIDKLREILREVSDATPHGGAC